MNLDRAQEWAVILGGLVTVVAALVGWWRVVRPRIRRTRGEIVAIRDSILGREAIIDTITGVERAPALPGIGVRMAANEENLSRLTDAVAKIAESHVRLENHEQRIKALEDASVERVVARAESAQAWRAIDTAIKATPDATEPEEHTS